MWRVGQQWPVHAHAHSTPGDCTAAAQASSPRVALFSRYCSVCVRVRDLLRSFTTTFFSLRMRQAGQQRMRQSAACTCWPALRHFPRDLRSGSCCSARQQARLPHSTRGGGVLGVDLHGQLGEGCQQALLQLPLVATAPGNRGSQLDGGEGAAVEQCRTHAISCRCKTPGMPAACLPADQPLFFAPRFQLLQRGRWRGRTT